MGDPQDLDEPTRSDDADARGEHLYDDVATQRVDTEPSPLERKRGHYAAGADGTQDVTARPGSGAGGPLRVPDADDAAGKTD